MPPLVIPHTFHDNVGEAASGAQVSENFTYLKEVLDKLPGLRLIGDFQGVLLSAPAAGAYMFQRSGAEMVKVETPEAERWQTTAGNVAQAGFQSADWQVPHKEMQVLVILSMLCNETPPGIEINARLVHLIEGLSVPPGSATLAKRFSLLGGGASIGGWPPPPATQAPKAGLLTRAAIGPVLEANLPLLKPGGGTYPTPLSVVIDYASAPAALSSMQIQASIYMQNV